MFRCDECGETFDIPERMTETHGFSSPPYEEYFVSPCCYSGFSECDGEIEDYEPDLEFVSKHIIKAVCNLNILRDRLKGLFDNYQVANDVFNNTVLSKVEDDLHEALHNIFDESGMDSSVQDLIFAANDDKSLDVAVKNFLEGAGL